jgi:hypothetical protein
MVRVPSSQLLELYLGLESNRQQQFHTKRLAVIMRKLGWEPEYSGELEDQRMTSGGLRSIWSQ